ncbi:MAG: T9SS type A sorting domain-containing protein [Sphingobacteriaceae bacterium]|nr:MAG: T9SS type A sorting domain-containing protein [Sphingobacteriaceae bacterium]
MNTNSRCTKTFILTMLACAACNMAWAQQANKQYLQEAYPASWVAMEVGEKPDSTNVWIRNGHTITLDGNETFKGIMIEQGAALNSDADARAESRYQLRSVGSGLGILNNGTFGSTTGTKDGIDLLITPSTKVFTILGTGKTTIASIRPEKANNGLTLNISQDISLNGNNVTFSAIPVIGNTSLTDNITFNIEAGKTVKIISPNGELNGITGTGPGGRYTYNVNGTLDVSATNTVQNLAPFKTTPASVLTFNIKGTLKFGSSLNIGSPGDFETGKLALNVLNGGVADAIATNTLTFGYNYFSTNGTGVLKRRVNNTDVIFPVGLGTIGPIALKSTAAFVDIAVSVKNEFDVPLPNTFKVVYKQWTISPANGNPIAVSLVMRPVWSIHDVGSYFDSSLPISLLWREPGQTTWNDKAATLTGKGTLTSPFIAFATGITNFGIFAIQNSSTNLNTNSVVTLYPNPTARTVNVIFPETTTDGTLSITSYKGGQMLKTNVRKGSTSWTYDVAAWENGIYFLHMETGDKVTALKFIKQ